MAVHFCNIAAPHEPRLQKRTAWVRNCSLITPDDGKLHFRTPASLPSRGSSRCATR